MKKLFGIVAVVLLFANIANAELKGLKEFKLSIQHSGNDCNGEKFDKEVETSAKYILGNSKIKLIDSYDGEILAIYILTGSSDSLCASSIEVYSFSVGLSKNSSGHEFVSTVRSYENDRITANSPIYDHKKNVIDAVEIMLKEFVVKWNEDNS